MKQKQQFVMNDLKNKHKDYFGIYPNVVTENFCKKVIDKYNFYEKYYSGQGGVNKDDIRYFADRQEEEGMPKKDKDGGTLFLSLDESDYITEFCKKTWQCYREYEKNFPSVTMAARHKMDNCVRLQKTKISQGYHMWHSDGAARATCDRILGIILYLNDVKEGGETEFLYQKLRIKPKQGTLIIFPTSFQYVHRGNPPLSGDKYILTSWLSFVD